LYLEIIEFFIGPEKIEKIEKKRKKKKKKEEKQEKTKEKGILTSGMSCLIFSN
jgi:hypothetical protein